MRDPRRTLLVPLVAAVLTALAGTGAQGQEEASPEQGAAELYQTYCGVCHQADGQGIEGAFPPLAGSRFLLENSERTIDIILFGLEEPINLDEFYEGAMPPVSYLSDEQVAAIMNYILNAWGNDGGTVTAEQVAERREAGEPVRFDRSDP